MKKSLPLRCAAAGVFFLLTFFNPFFETIAQAPSINVQAGVPVGNSPASGVAYGNGTYVVIFNSGSIYTSTNGNDWTKVMDTSVPAGTFNRIAFGGGKFVVVGTSGLIFYSTDGIHWTTASSGNTSTFYDIQYFNTSFYVVGPNTLLTSADGIIWTEVTINGKTASDQYRNIAYGNGMFVITFSKSGYGDLYTLRSATAESNTWTTDNLGFAFPNRVQFLKDRFYIFTSNTHVYTSTDGVSWTNSTTSMSLTLPDHSMQTIGSPNQIFHGLYDGSTFYFYGSSQYWKGYGGVFTSTDGINFTLQPMSAYIVSQGGALVNGKYFQYGNEGFVSSTDGINYKYPAGNFYGVASSGSGNYVAVGTVGVSGVVFTSSDFTNWRDHTPAETPELNGVTWSGSQYVAAGRGIFASNDDGNTWTQLATTGKIYNAIAYGASNFVVGGYDAVSGTAELAYAADATTWTTANTDNNWYFKIKYVNNGFFAMGMNNDTYEGIVYYSADGINWTNITPATSFVTIFYHDIVFDGSKYYLMGVDADYLFFSISGSTPLNTGSWSAPGGIVSAPVGALLGGYWGEGAFGYTGGHFAGSANDLNTNEAYTLYSDDGLSWTAVPTGETAYITGAITESNEVKLIGSGNIAISVNFGLSTLPVSLSSLTATLTNETSVLRWQTASEWNSKNFVVEHSTDRSNWTAIGTVAAAGSSNSTRQYEFVHKQPQVGINYYRLVQYDIDGRSETSQVVKVDLVKAGIRFSMHPNPAIDHTTLQLPSASASVVAIYDLKGRQVQYKKYSGNTITLSLHSLPKGYFQVVVDQDGRKFTAKLLHQ